MFHMEEKEDKEIYFTLNAVNCLCVLISNNLRG